MRLQVSARGMDTTGGLRTYVETRMHFALGRFSSRVLDTRVTLTKLKRSTARFDKRCRIRVRLRGLTNVVVEEVDKDFYGAIDRAADRARRAVVRRSECSSGL
jgi:ribosomal subunit interface protein